MSNKKANQTSTQKDAFFNLFIAELMKTSNELFEEHADPTQVFLKLRSQCGILPPKLKKQLKPGFDKILANIQKGGLVPDLTEEKWLALNLNQRIQANLIAVSDQISRFPVFCTTGTTAKNRNSSARTSP